MSAEGMPQHERSWMARPLASVTRLVLRAPRAVLSAAIIFALVAVLLAVYGLGFRTSRLDLLNPNSGYNKLWIDYIDEFGPDDDAVIVVEGSHRDEVLPVLDDLSEALADEQQLFHSVLHEVDLSKIRSKGLYQVDLDEVRRIDRYLDQIQPILQDDWSVVGLYPMAAGLNYRLQAAQQSGNVQQYATVETDAARLIDSLHASLVEGQTFRSPWKHASQGLDHLGQLDSEYLLANQGRWGIVLLKLHTGDDQFAQGTDAIDSLRQLMADVQAGHPGVKIGLTGLPIMENDEMRASQRDMLRASFISLFGVACIFAAGFGGVRHPLLTVVALLISMAWCFGYITLAIGHLNILSVSFSVILIGLGIDFGIHYAARYLQLRHQLADTNEALVQTASSVGPGILTGGVTTAIAFFTASLTEFTGVAELGIISGGGILLCILGAMIVLPAMIMLADGVRRRESVSRPLAVDSWLAPLLRRPRWVIAGTVVATGLLAMGMTDLRYDHNLLNLQPLGLESVELEQRLLEETDQSVWFALSIADTREQLLERKRQFEALPSVERTKEILSWLPADCATKQPLITRIRQRLANLAEGPPQIPVVESAVLGEQLALIHQRLASSRPVSRSVRRKIDQIRGALRGLPPRECLAQLCSYQQQMAGDLSTRLHLLRSVSNSQPPQLSDLPPGLVSRFVGKNNRHLLKIYGRGNIWDMEDLETFVLDVKHIDQAATGQPLQTYYASRQMQRSYLLAAGYALVAMIVVLLLDFHTSRSVLLALLPIALGIALSITQQSYVLGLGCVVVSLAVVVLLDFPAFVCAILALLPVGLALAQMFGVMGWLNVPLNPANLIVLPLILGIGIDDGVHVVHDFRRQAGRYRLSSSTATAVLITSLTTMMGFGSLMLAGHRGLQSLGRVLTIGVCCCLVTSIVLLPAVLAWATRHRPAATPPDDEPPLPAETRDPDRVIRRVDKLHDPAAGSRADRQHPQPRSASVRPRRR